MLWPFGLSSKASVRSFGGVFNTCFSHNGLRNGFGCFADVLAVAVVDFVGWIFAEFFDVFAVNGIFEEFSFRSSRFFSHGISGSDNLGRSLMVRGPFEVEADAVACGSDFVDNGCLAGDSYFDVDAFDFSGESGNKREIARAFRTASIGELCDVGDRAFCDDGVEGFVWDRGSCESKVVRGLGDAWDLLGDTCVQRSVFVGVFSFVGADGNFSRIEI